MSLLSLNPAATEPSNPRAMPASAIALKGLEVAHGNGDHRPEELGPIASCPRCQAAAQRTVEQAGAGPSLASLPLAASRNATVAWRNDYLTVEMLDSHFGPYSSIRSASDRGAVALAVRDGSILLVAQPRYPVGQWCWELPRGSAKAGEGMGDVARREASEETGFNLHSCPVTDLGTVHPDSGLLQTVVGLVLIDATVAPVTPSLPTDGEANKARWVAAGDVVDACVSGVIADAFTVAAVLRARVRGLL